MNKVKLVFVALLVLMAAPLQADFFGLANGRTANMDNLANMSVEAGANIKSNFNTFGGRFNYKVSPDMVVFGDLGQSNFFGASGFSYGVGVFYQLRNVTLLENTDFAVKGAYHGGTLEIDGCEEAFGAFLIAEICDYSASELTLEALISGDQLANTDFAWYANAGLHNLEGGSEIGFGGGIVGSLAFGDWFAGVDLIDQFFIVGGIRYNLN